ncbi:GL13289 [Drosophila persimilis]|uniref:GL13289 n=1 Tax=Drosophila persimilis TaxID=7234 RepID=B4IRU4_DROPE|nr:GL13289 [Drosophila persimilis]
MFGSVVQYDPLETIYVEDKGSLNMVHFILSGECVVLQCLNLKINHSRGKTIIDLSDMEKDESKAMFLETRNSSYAPEQSYLDVQNLLASTSSEEEGESKGLRKQMRKMGLKEIEAFCGLGPASFLEKHGHRRKTVMHAKRITHKPRRPTIESEEIEDAEEEEQFFDYEDYFEYFGEEVSVESEFSLAVESSSSETKA